MLMLLVFTGQTVSASAMSCHMMIGSATSLSHDMSAMDHDMSAMNHDMHMDDETGLGEAPVMKDCCKLSGHCSSGGCSTLGFAHQLYINFAMPLTTRGHDYLRVIPASPVTSHFKPPILC